MLFARPVSTEMGCFGFDFILSYTIYFNKIIIYLIEIYGFYLNFQYYEWVSIYFAHLNKVIQILIGVILILLKNIG